jgi:hypothetical protein
MLKSMMILGSACFAFSTFAYSVSSAKADIVIINGSGDGIDTGGPVQATGFTLQSEDGTLIDSSSNTAQINSFSASQIDAQGFIVVGSPVEIGGAITGYAISPNGSTITFAGAPFSLAGTLTSNDRGVPVAAGSVGNLQGSIFGNFGNQVGVDNQGYVDIPLPPIVPEDASPEEIGDVQQTLARNEQEIERVQQEIERVQQEIDAVPSQEDFESLIREERNRELAQREQSLRSNLRLAKSLFNRAEASRDEEVFSGFFSDILGIAKPRFPRQQATNRVVDGAVQSYDLISTLGNIQGRENIGRAARILGQSIYSDDPERLDELEIAIQAYQRSENASPVPFIGSAYARISDSLTYEGFLNYFGARSSLRYRLAELVVEASSQYNSQRQYNSQVQSGNPIIGSLDDPDQVSFSATNARNEALGSLPSELSDLQAQLGGLQADRNNLLGGELTGAINLAPQPQQVRQPLRSLIFPNSSLSQ